MAPGLCRPPVHPSPSPPVGMMPSKNQLWAAYPRHLVQASAGAASAYPPLPRPSELCEVELIFDLASPHTSDHHPPILFPHSHSTLTLLPVRSDLVKLQAASHGRHSGSSYHCPVCAEEWPAARLGSVAPRLQPMPLPCAQGRPGRMPPFPPPQSINLTKTCCITSRNPPRTLPSTCTEGCNPSAALLHADVVEKPHLRVERCGVLSVELINHAPGCTKW